MKRFLPLLLVFWFLPSAQFLWSAEQADYPRYEPPQLEEMPDLGKPTPAPTGETATARPGETATTRPGDGATGRDGETATRRNGDADVTAAPAAEPTAPPDASDLGNDVAPSRPVAGSPGRSPTAMTRYKVWIYQENGDSLSRIAQKMYGDPMKWKLIYLANKDIIKDPNRIYPKQRLKIPPADWQP